MALREELSFHFVFDVAVDNVLVCSQDVRKEEFVAVPVHVQGFVDGYLKAGFVVSAQVHEGFHFQCSGRHRWPA